MYTEHTEWGLKRCLSSSTKWKKLADLINQKQKLQRWLTREEKKKATFWRDQHRQSYPAAVH